MKKVFMIFGLCFCMLLTGCGNAYAKQEYGSDELIAQEGDRYSKSVSVSNDTGSGFTYTASEFDGRETVWNKRFSSDRDMNVNLKISISAGSAKVVYIDPGDNVTVITELSEDSTERDISETISFKKGRNRIKLVGYDCKNVSIDGEIGEK